ncbi:MAG: hypothetical protein NTZ19_13080 [Bacteroidetes bacterium]|nr:hypothetical protein [Bacteroidota bacterium]
MKRTIYITAIFSSMILCFALPQNVQAQDHSKAIAAADSSRFSPNKKDGWQLFNSFVSKYQKDSAQVELILQHDGTIDWKQEQLVGKIKFQPLQPGSTQSLPFKLLNETYSLRIDDKGKCYLKFVNGIMPSANPFIIPLKVNYKL